jgi:hypothetical protein
MHGKRPSKWLTVYKIPCVSRLRGEKKTPELCRSPAASVSTRSVDVMVPTEGVSIIAT